MGVAIEEVVGTNDLVSLGMDSLMSICILGILREQTGLDLSSSFFLDNPSIDAIEQYLGLGHSAGPALASPKRKKISQMSTPASTTTPATPMPQAVSILMQGKPKTANKTLFLFPDGSGSATSYSSIPAIGPKVAVYGLNSPFMTNPSDFTNGIPGIASLYLDEVKRRQPKGPYYLGGWSAGGVVAYEATIQLLAASERVTDLILFDSPCPIKLEPLPGRLHRFFADIGLFGGPGVEPPAWLLGHFESSIKALAAYDPPPIEDKSLIPRVLAVWARQGVCGGPNDPKLESREDDPKSMKWLLENRTDFGTNGWEALVGEEAMKLESIDGNHFTLMKDREQVGFPLYSLSNKKANGNSVEPPRRDAERLLVRNFIAQSL
ncbi:MAG: hypothetical protein Q9214_005596 [Letrouitia sp. 1 TL-2023]